MTSGACKPATPGGDINGDWELETGIVDGQLIPLRAGLRVTVFVKGRELSGRSACNGYGATIDNVGGRLQLSSLGGTLMLCNEATMAVEIPYIRGLGRVAQATVSGDRLVLAGPST